MAEGRTPPDQSAIAISDLMKDFGDVRAVNGLNLEIKKDMLWVGI